MSIDHWIMFHSIGWKVWIPLGILIYFLLPDSLVPFVYGMSLYTIVIDHMGAESALKAEKAAEGSSE